MSYAFVPFLLSGLLGTPTEAEQQPPNIVVLFIDDMGYADPSCFGNPVLKTPNIDRLAAEGIKLTNFYVNSPICSASRVALTTGRYQQRYRIHSYFASRASNRERKMPDWLDPNVTTLAKILKKRGYHTAHFGKWHMGGGRDVGDAPLPQAYGFDESLVAFEGLGDRILWQKTGNQRESWHHGRGKILSLPKHKTTETYVNRAIDFIERYKNDSFYVRVFPNDVHDPHIPSEQQLAKWKGSSKNPPDEKFFAVLDEMDRHIGRLLDTIDRLQLAEKTLILFTSDNGPTDWPHYYKSGFTPPGFTGPLFGRKWSLYEGGIRMPFIARWTGHIPAGATNDTTIMAAIDVLPTLAKLTGSQLPDGVELDGIDLSAALFDNTVADVGVHSDHIHAVSEAAETLDGKTTTGTACVVPAKYASRNDLVAHSVQRPAPLFWEYGVYGSIVPGKAEHISPQLAMRDGNWKLLCQPDGSRLMLFNLADDIGEKRNVATQHPGITNRMKQQLLAWWATMNAYYSGI